MSLTSIAAIYLLFWVITAFVVMPFGVRTADELGVEKVRGQADSAPANFRPMRVILITTLLSAVVFGLFYANYINGWISPSDVNIFGKPPGLD
jgi:predicted secreted protein